MCHSSYIVCWHVMRTGFFTGSEGEQSLRTTWKSRTANCFGLGSPRCLTCIVFPGCLICIVSAGCLTQVSHLYCLSRVSDPGVSPVLSHQGDWPRCLTIVCPGFHLYCLTRVSHPGDPSFSPVLSHQGVWPRCLICIVSSGCLTQVSHLYCLSRVSDPGVSTIVSPGFRVSLYCLTRVSHPGCLGETATKQVCCCGDVNWWLCSSGTRRRCQRCQ